MSILVVAAHPDDEVLSCGATMAKLSSKEPVHLLILGEGLTSRLSKTQKVDTRALASLRNHAKAAAKVLGARSVQFESFPDNRFDTVALLDIVKRIEFWISKYKPDTLYTHHGGDLNIDHAMTFRAVLTASRPQPGCGIKKVFSCEVNSATEWAFDRFMAFRPNVFIDVSKTIEKKIEALEKYEGELREFPHPRSGEGLRVQARRWGSVVGVEYAEAFELIRSLG